MPEFTNPFPGMVPGKKMNREQLLRALRLDLAAEEDATHLYTAHAEATDDPLARKVLRSIADEEIVHVGEFQALLKRLSPREEYLLSQGEDEVAQAARTLAGLMK